MSTSKKLAGRLLVLLLMAVGADLSAQADGIHVVQTLRLGGCGGLVRAVAPLARSNALDQAAARWAGGEDTTAALQRSGYRARQWASLHYTGTDAAAFQQVRRGACQDLMDSGLSELGVFHQGADTWVVMAAPGTVRAQSSPPVPTEPAPPGPVAAAPPPLLAHAPLVPRPQAADPSPITASRVLELVNAARARGAVCGEHSFAPVPPVRLSAPLGQVAYGHATDMAEHNYFEHEDLQGRTPADRVKASGYAEKLVGENIAYGPTSAEEVVQGWLDSPGHCENIMDPRFAEMGIAYAPGRVQRHGLYWVQLLVAPRA